MTILTRRYWRILAWSFQQRIIRSCIWICINKSIILTICKSKQSSRKVQATKMHSQVRMTKAMVPIQERRFKWSRAWVFMKKNRMKQERTRKRARRRKKDQKSRKKCKHWLTKLSTMWLLAVSTKGKSPAWIFVYKDLSLRLFPKLTPPSEYGTTRVESAN